MKRFLLRMTVLGCALGVTLPARGEIATTEMALELTSALADFDRAQQLLADRPEAARPLFRAAAQRMESLAVRVPNGYLEYNIGNAYLQAGNLGRAILHYRRAERLVPRDPLLADNLREARSRRLLSIKSNPRDRLLGYVFFWHQQTSRRERAELAALAFLSVWMFLLVRLFHRRRGWVVAACVSGAISVACGTSVATDVWMDRGAPAGVIVGMDVPVYKGPGATYQRHLEQPLQHGVEFTLRERRGTWWRVELADGKTGWIDAAQADLVVQSHPGAPGSGSGADSDRPY